MWIDGGRSSWSLSPRRVLRGIVPLKPSLISSGLTARTLRMSWRPKPLSPPTARRGSRADPRAAVKFGTPVACAPGRIAVRRHRSSAVLPSNGRGSARAVLPGAAAEGQPHSYEANGVPHDEPHYLLGAPGCSLQFPEVRIRLGPGSGALVGLHQGWFARRYYW